MFCLTLNEILGVLWELSGVLCFRKKNSLWVYPKQVFFSYQSIYSIIYTAVRECESLYICMHLHVCVCMWLHVCVYCYYYWIIIFKETLLKFLKIFLKVSYLKDKGQKGEQQVGCHGGHLPQPSKPGQGGRQSLLWTTDRSFQLPRLVSHEGL